MKRIIGNGLIICCLACILIFITGCIDDTPAEENPPFISPSPTTPLPPATVMTTHVTAPIQTAAVTVPAPRNTPKTASEDLNFIEKVQNSISVVQPVSNQLYQSVAVFDWSNATKLSRELNRTAEKEHDEISDQTVTPEMEYIKQKYLGILLDLEESTVAYNKAKSHTGKNESGTVESYIISGNEKYTEASKKIKDLNSYIEDHYL